MKKIAFLGLGAMGSRMATKLVEAGFEVSVWNRSLGASEQLKQIGAQLASTPAEAANGKDIVISMVRDIEASQYVWFEKEIGAVNGMKPGAIGIESSTLTITAVKTLHTRFSERGIRFVDAPLAGSRPQAEAAKLIYFVGTDKETFSEVSPVLDKMGASINHAGPVGSATAIKLAVNALFGGQLALIAELIGMLKRSGLDAAQAIEIISATPVCSPAVKISAGAMLAGQFAPAFPIELVDKDFGYIESASTDLGAATPMVEVTRLVLKSAIEKGYGDDNITGLAQLYF